MMSMATATLERIWSPYQSAIFDFLETGSGSAVIEACAGSGKTTVLVECARRLPPEDSCLFAAFNKRVADELRRRLPGSASAMTLNSLGFKAWRDHVGKLVEVDGSKVTALVRTMSDDSNTDFKAGVKKLVDMAKLVGIVPRAVEALGCRGLVPDETDYWECLINEYDIVFGQDGKQDRAIALARRILTENVRLGSRLIDFNDQLYLPVIFNAEFPRFDYVFVDELQDFNNLNFEIASRALIKGGTGRFIGCGDSAQGIYGWRGAGTDSMSRAVERFGAKKFPLSISYRCPKAVVEKARQYSSKIELFDQAEDGIVQELESWAPSTFLSTDVILCRNNAPLVAMAFKLIRAGKPCKVLGRDIGTGLVALVRRMKAISLDDLKSKLDAHVNKESLRLTDEPEKMVSLLDRVDTIRIFVSEMPWGTSVEQLCNKIESMFSEDSEQGMITLSTVHKFKGLENDRIFVLDFHLIGLRQPECNLQYVCVTRSKRELYFITSK